MKPEEPPLEVTVTPGWRLWYGVMNALLIEAAAVCLVATIIAPYKYKGMYAGTLLVCVIIFLIGLWLTRKTHGGLDKNQPA